LQLELGIEIVGEWQLRCHEGVAELETQICSFVLADLQVSIMIDCCRCSFVLEDDSMEFVGILFHFSAPKENQKVIDKLYSLIQTGQTSKHLNSVYCVYFF
jgi:hypothetical protein